MNLNVDQQDHNSMMQNYGISVPPGMGVAPGDSVTVIDTGSHKLITAQNCDKMSKLFEIRYDQPETCYGLIRELFARKVLLDHENILPITSINVLKLEKDDPAFAAERVQVYMNVLQYSGSLDQLVQHLQGRITARICASIVNQLMTIGKYLEDSKFVHRKIMPCEVLFAFVMAEPSEVLQPRTDGVAGFEHVFGNCQPEPDVAICLADLEHCTVLNPVSKPEEIKKDLPALGFVPPPSVTAGTPEYWQKYDKFGIGATIAWFLNSVPFKIRHETLRIADLMSYGATLRPMFKEIFEENGLPSQKILMSIDPDIILQSLGSTSSAARMVRNAVTGTKLHINTFDEHVLNEIITELGEATLRTRGEIQQVLEAYQAIGSKQPFPKVANIIDQMVARMQNRVT